MEVPKYVLEEIERAISQLGKQGANVADIREKVEDALTDPMVIEDLKSMIGSANDARVEARTCSRVGLGLALSSLETSLFFAISANKRGREKTPYPFGQVQMGPTSFGEAWPNVVGEMERRIKLQFLDILIDECGCTKQGSK